MMNTAHALLKNVFSKYPNVIAASSLRAQGNMSLTHGDVSQSLVSRRAFLDSLSIPFDALVCPQQVHGAQVAIVNVNDRGKGALNPENALQGTDALITDSKGVALSIFTADCLCVFLFDQKRHVLGLVHAGWKSTQKRIAAVTVDAMRHNFKTDPQDVVAYFSPALRSCCYEVTQEFKSIFPEFVFEKNGKLFFDLVSVNKIQLQESGVLLESLEDNGMCTGCNQQEYFSYRKQGSACARMMSVAMLC